jgi:hypothetical protein
MTVKVGLTRRVAVVCIGIGIFIFSVALVAVISMYLTFSPNEGAGLTLIPGLILFNGYIVLSICNLIGGLIIYFLSENNKLPFSRATKTVFSLQPLLKRCL